MKNKIALFFLALSASTATPAVFAETQKTNTTQSQTIDTTSKTEVNENISPENPEVTKYCWKNIRKKLAVIKDIMVLIASFQAIEYFRYRLGKPTLFSYYALRNH